jgi:hypothetical protein
METVVMETSVVRSEEPTCYRTLCCSPTSLPESEGKAIKRDSGVYQKCSGD